MARPKIIQNPIPFQLRLPQKLHDRILAAARRHGTSINVEIINRLAGSLSSAESREGHRAG